MINSYKKVPLKLRKKLLSIGGTRVAPMSGDEAEMAALLARGKLFSQPIRIRRGRRNQCHINAAALWGEDIETYSLVTGFALTRGCWYEHSWVVDKNYLYETTLKCEVYFGIELDKLHSCRFWVCNFLEMRYAGPWHLMLETGKQAQRAKNCDAQVPNP